MYTVQCAVTRTLDYCWKHLHSADSMVMVWIAMLLQ